MKNKRVHFTGIKGVGMAPLAIIAKQAGFEVTGSDVAEVFITDRELNDAGIIPIVGFSAENVKGKDLVIATGAHGGKQNIEVIEAAKNGITVLSQGEALGLFQSGEIFGKEFSGISVAGSHGKTTTSAMIATLLTENNLNPSFVIGTGDIPSLGASGKFGKGKYFVAEADEYVVDSVSDKTPKFMFQHPEYLVITNIDFDHPDVYPSINEIHRAFAGFVDNLKSNGVLIVCGDGAENQKFINQVNVNKVTYGASPKNDYVLESVSSSPEGMFFRISSRGAHLGEFSMPIFGEHNAINAMSAVVLGLEIGLSLDQIKKGLSAFRGTKRRAELIGKTESGAFVYDDYGHHPEEIKKTLTAFRNIFPKKYITVIFQPHMFSRTKILFNDFATAFSEVNEVILMDIFPSFREVVDPNFSSLLLVEEINKFGKKALYMPNQIDVIKYLTSAKLSKESVIITMGAGDVYKIGRVLETS